MKRTIFVLLLLCYGLLAGCAATESQRRSFRSEPEGFRGIRWGTDISLLSGMKFSHEAKPDTNGVIIKYYVKNNDELKFNTVNLEKVLYGFYNDKFYSGQILTIGVINYSKLRSEAFKLYGDGKYFYDSGDPPVENYQWLGESTRMFIRYNIVWENCWLALFSEKICQEKERSSSQKK